MNPVTKRLTTNYCELSEEQADTLAATGYDGSVIEVRPPPNGRIPETITATLNGVREMQSDWLKLRNRSLVIAFELRRTSPDRIRLQFAAPTKRLERKLRTHLHGQIPGVGFADGVSGLPVSEDTTVGGGLLTTGQDSWYPLRTEFDNPAMNTVIGALHRHAMQDTRFVIQILMKPQAGKRFRRSWWRRRAYKEIDYLKKEKEKLWGSRKPTKQERKQAAAIEQKVSGPLFATTIRVLVLDANDYTGSRLKEVGGAFNVYENPETGQYLRTKPVRSMNENNIRRFAQAVADRQFGQWSLKFPASATELGGLVSIPSRKQQNLGYAEP